MIVFNGPIIRAGQSAKVPLFLEDASGDPVTGKSGTMTVKFSVNGGAWDTSPLNSPSEIGDGYYQINLDSSETGSSDGTIVVYAKDTASKVCMVSCQLRQYGIPADVIQNQDKTAYRLSASGVADIRDMILEGTYTLGEMIASLFDSQFAPTDDGGTEDPILRNMADSVNRATYQDINTSTGDRPYKATMNFTDLP